MPAASPSWFGHGPIGSTTSPTPVACACEDIVTSRGVVGLVDEFSVRSRSRFRLRFDEGCDADGARRRDCVASSARALSASSGRMPGSSPSASAARGALVTALVRMRNPRGNPLMSSNSKAEPPGRPAATSVMAPISNCGSAPSTRRSAPSCSTDFNEVAQVLVHCHASVVTAATTLEHARCSVIPRSSVLPRGSFGNPAARRLRRRGINGVRRRFVVMAQGVLHDREPQLAHRW